MEQLLGSWTTLTAAGVLLLGGFAYFRALSRGTLWTGKQHDESMAQKDEIIGIYKARGDKLEIGYAEQVRQNSTLVEQLKIFGHFIEDADRVTGKAPSTGDSSNVEGPGHVRT